MYLRILRKPQIKKNSVLQAQCNSVNEMRSRPCSKNHKIMAGNILYSIQGSEHAINHYMSNLKIHKVRTHMPSVPGDLLFWLKIFKFSADWQILLYSVLKYTFHELKYMLCLNDMSTIIHYVTCFSLNLTESMHVYVTRSFILDSY